MAHLAAHRLISWCYFDSERFIVTRSCHSFHRTKPKESTRTISFGRYMYTLAILSILIRIGRLLQTNFLLFVSGESIFFCFTCLNRRYCDRMGMLACDSRCGLSSSFGYGMWWFIAGKVSEFAASLRSLVGETALCRSWWPGFFWWLLTIPCYYRTARYPTQRTKKAFKDVS